MLNRVESTDYSRASTCVHIHEYPLTLAKVGIGQMSRLNALCLAILVLCCFVLFTNSVVFIVYMYMCLERHASV